MVVLQTGLTGMSIFLQKTQLPVSSIMKFLPWILILVVLALLVLQQIKLKRLGVEVKKLRKMNATKDRFFSILGHDLKSPFNSLMGFSEMLSLHAESMDSSQVLNYSQIIHQTTRRLFMLVENLLQWSRSQTGTTRYEPEKLDLNAVTGNVVNLLRLNAQEKDIVISLKLEPDLVAWADADLYRTVVRNLLSNGIKFSPVGSVVYVTGKRVNTMIEIVVSDTGVGMGREQMADLFQLDKPHSTPGTLNERGTGLGLLLCKEFSEINKGNIQVNSLPGKGTQVKFSVPGFSSQA